MTCETVKPLLSEFADDTLNAATFWQVQMHLAECMDCGKISRDLRGLHQMLSALPARQPSAQFDAALARRLALTRKPQQRRQAWQEWLQAAFPIPRLLLRPALALGAAAMMGGAWLLLPLHNLTAPVPNAIVHPGDRAFVADCVDQRSRDAAGEPLADIAAQNLAGHLDNSPPTLSASGVDSGLF